jgi:hypothetical protein
MEIALTITELAKRNPHNQLYAVDNKGKPYLISRPITSDEKDKKYFSALHDYVKEGKCVAVRANIHLNSNNATLISPNNLEDAISRLSGNTLVIDVMAPGPQQYEGTVNADIIPINLYDLVFSTIIKNRSYKTSSLNIIDQNSAKRLDALKAEKPQQRLKTDRLAREIVKSLLCTDMWTELKGKSSGMYHHGAVFFPDIDNAVLIDKTKALMNEDGLLDVRLTNNRDGRWCFQSEINYTVTPSFDVAFVKNYELRNALKIMLQPFNAEKNMFTIVDNFY